MDARVLYLSRADVEAVGMPMRAIATAIRILERARELGIGTSVAL
jgi:hypothetical protein